MADLYELLQEVVDYSDEKKLSLITDLYRELLPAFREIDEETEGLSFVADIIGAAVSADDTVTSSEMAVMRKVMDESGLDLSDDALDGLVRDSSTDGVRNMVIRLSEILDQDLRGSLALLVAAICSVDDRISEEEIAYISKMLD